MQELTPEQKAKLEQSDRLARQILEYARNTLFMNLRFMKNVLGRCELVPYHGTVGTDAVNFYYSPKYILNQFKENQKQIIRTYLHTILHCIFQHQFVSPFIDRPVWNLSCDIAVEKIIQELRLDTIDTTPEINQNRTFSYLQDNIKYMTAEKIYEFLTEKKTFCRIHSRTSKRFSAG